MGHAVTVLQVTERRACRAIGQIRYSYRYKARSDPFRERLRERIIARTKEYGRSGYRTVTDLLRLEGWDVGKDRVYSVYTIGRQEGLKEFHADEPLRDSRSGTSTGCLARPGVEAIAKVIVPRIRSNVVVQRHVYTRVSTAAPPFEIINLLRPADYFCLASRSCPCSPGLRVATQPIGNLQK